GARKGYASDVEQRQDRDVVDKATHDSLRGSAVRMSRTPNRPHAHGGNRSALGLRALLEHYRTRDSNAGALRQAQEVNPRGTASPHGHVERMRPRAERTNSACSDTPPCQVE